ncbi:MAG TPA: type II toxin-antitoxin system RelE/ParE family toxin [Leptospiraceae bacterium]|nr:type II toxin-antitoxin system RelE/ParE family toxin [Leptospiraceae bacterium]HRG76727.1 type II toxin-antitoxin system RelE/ParE family toxin [Leptospiraceae bacterium]
MAKRIIWSEKAVREKESIFNYWINRNGTKTYSKKLAEQFNKSVEYILKFNFIGKETTRKDIRVSVSGNYLIFYRIQETEIQILSLRDSRQNPKTLKL